MRLVIVLQVALLASSTATLTWVGGENEEVEYGQLENEEVHEVQDGQHQTWTGGELMNNFGMTDEAVEDRKLSSNGQTAEDPYICANGEEKAKCKCDGLVYYGRKYAPGQGSDSQALTFEQLKSYAFIRRLSMYGSLQCDNHTTYGMGGTPVGLEAVPKLCYCDPAGFGEAKDLYDGLSHVQHEGHLTVSLEDFSQLLKELGEWSEEEIKAVYKSILNEYDYVSQWDWIEWVMVGEDRAAQQIDAYLAKLKKNALGNEFGGEWECCLGTGGGKTTITLTGIKFPWGMWAKIVERSAKNMTIEYPRGSGRLHSAVFKSLQAWEGRTEEGLIWDNGDRWTRTYLRDALQPDVPAGTDFKIVGWGACRTAGGNGLYGTTKLSTLDMCQTRCALIPWCVGFEYEPPSKLCEIHFEPLTHVETAEKFTNAGVQCWAKLTPSKYDISLFKTRQLGTVGQDAAYALAVDAAGDIYLGGTMFNGNLLGLTSQISDRWYSDSFIMKYTSHGEKLWTKLIPRMGKDEVRGMATNRAGEVMVVGSCPGELIPPRNKFHTDGLVMMLKPNGTIKWTLTMGRGTYSEKANAVAIASSPPPTKDRIYVVGQGEGSYAHFWQLEESKWSGTYWNTGKGETTGEVHVTVQVAHQLYQGDATAVTVNAAGEAIIVGEHWEDIGGQRSQRSRQVAVTVMGLSSDGFAQKKNEVIRGMGVLTEDAARAVAVASDGSVLVAGFTSGSLDGQKNAGGMDIFLMKFDKDLKWIWTRQRGTPLDDFGNAMSVDSNDNIFVTGATSGNLDGQRHVGGHDIFLMKFDLDGQWWWTLQHGSGGDDESMALGLDASGNAIMAGYASGLIVNTPGCAQSWIGGSDIFLVKKTGDWCPAGEVKQITFSMKADSGSCTGYKDYARSGIIAFDGVRPDVSMDRTICEGVALYGMFPADSPFCTGFCQDVHQLEAHIASIYFVNKIDLALLLTGVAIMCGLIVYKILCVDGHFQTSTVIFWHVIIFIVGAADGVLQIYSLVLSFLAMPTVDTIYNSWCVDTTHPNGMEQFGTLVKLRNDVLFVIVIGVFELVMGSGALVADAKLALNYYVDRADLRWAAKHAQQLADEAINTSDKDTPPSPDSIDNASDAEKRSASKQTSDSAASTQTPGSEVDARGVVVGMDAPVQAERQVIRIDEDASNDTDEAALEAGQMNVLQVVPASDQQAVPQKPGGVIGTLKRVASNENVKNVRIGVKEARAAASRLILWAVLGADILDASAATVDFFVFTMSAKSESDTFFTSLKSDPYSWCLWPSAVRHSDTCGIDSGVSAPTSAASANAFPCLMLVLVVFFTLTGLSPRR